MSLPVNFQPLDIANVESAADYAMGVARNQFGLLSQAGLDPKGLNFLELGPGWDFGAGLILASAGVTVTVADRFLSGWQQDFHSALYRRLAERWDGPVDQLQAAAEGGYEATTLVRLQEPAEALVSIPDANIDFVYSNAVLEHVVDIGAVAAELSRITRPGGRSAHQIDMRYHRNFSRPLDHLALPERDFALSAADDHYECGNRFRPSEFVAHFGLSGFELAAYHPNGFSTDAYLEEFEPLLRGSLSAYRHWPRADLEHVCAMFLFDKLDGPGEALRLRGEVAVDMGRTLKAQTLAAMAREPWTPSIPYDDHELPLSKLGGHSGLMWTFNADDIPPGDTLEDNAVSTAVLLEDGRPLGPGHAAHELIRNHGGGRFSHWYQQVHFSTSDGSSPATNGRRYTLRVPRSGRFY